MEELQEILGVLRTSADDALRPRQDLGDLDELIDEARRAGTPVRLDNRLTEPETLPAAVTRTAFRLVQEGLTNARKHAPGAEVAVCLDRTDSGELHVWLRNPLPASPVVPSLPGSRSGLVGLAERVNLEAVRRVAAGEQMLSPSVVKQLIAHVVNDGTDERRRAALNALATLSPRERDVAEAVAAGCSNAEISAAVHMSVATVKTYVSRILGKLGCSNRVQVAIVVHESRQGAGGGG